MSNSSGTATVSDDAWSIRRRLSRLKASYTTRHVVDLIREDAAGVELLSEPGLRPRPGDVVLARVREIGQHRRIELPDSRRARLYLGDEVLVAYGNRYAPDQFEAEVPDDLGPTNLVAAGGVAASVVSQHDHMEPATEIEPVGLLSLRGRRVNLALAAPHRLDGSDTAAWDRATRPPVMAVVGTSMNSGKSTVAGALIRGLTRAGLAVAAAKVTGTGAGGDSRLFADSGAVSVLDFTDFGYPSTYQLAAAEVEALLERTVALLAAEDPDVIVLEVADGVFQQETAALVAGTRFPELVDSVLFAASDAAGAWAGVSVLTGQGLSVVAVTGRLTAAPLAIREAASVLELPVVVTDELTEPEVATGILSGLVTNRREPSGAVLAG